MDFPVTRVSSNLYSKTKLTPTRTETETVFLGKTNGMKSDPPFLVWFRISIEPPRVSMVSRWIRFPPPNWWNQVERRKSEDLELEVDVFWGVETVNFGDGSFWLAKESETTQKPKGCPLS